jgi:hypothetical protein
MTQLPDDSSPSSLETKTTPKDVLAGFLVFLAPLAAIIVGGLALIGALFLLFLLDII